MVLVHDDDLAQICGNCDSEVNEYHMFRFLCHLAHVYRFWGLSNQMQRKVPTIGPTRRYTQIYFVSAYGYHTSPNSNKRYEKIWHLSKMPIHKSLEWRCFRGYLVSQVRIYALNV